MVFKHTKKFKKVNETVMRYIHTCIVHAKLHLNQPISQDSSDEFRQKHTQEQNKNFLDFGEAKFNTILYIAYGESDEISVVKG